MIVGELAPAEAEDPKTVTASGQPRDRLGSSSEDAVLTLAEAERRAIVRALRVSGGAKQEAANLLGTSRRTLYNKIRAYGLESLGRLRVRRPVPRLGRVRETTAGEDAQA